MKISLLCFGMVAEITGFSKREEEVSTGTSIAELTDQLIAAHPPLKQVSFRISANKEIVSPDVKIADGDVIALLPPFAGG